MLHQFVCSTVLSCEALAPLSQPRFNSEKCGGHSWFRTNIMPQDRYSSQDAFDVEILNPRTLNAPDGLATALRTIEAICRLGDPAIARMVEALSSRSYILEYIISGTFRIPIGPCTLPALIILL